MRGIKMKTIVLGKTGLTVTELGFGGIPIIPLGMKEGAEVVRHCYDLGITFFDTANIYADSEKKIGLALADVRDRIVLATKSLRRDAEGVASHIEYSLSNMKTGYIDIFQFHNVSGEESMQQILAPGGAYEAAAKARKEGKVRFIGFSSHNVSIALKMCHTGLFSTVQIPFNFIETEPLAELFPLAGKLDMGIICMKPLGGGLLESPDLCFRFLQQYPKALPIPGVVSKQEMDEIVSFYRSPQPLSKDDLADIERIRKELGTRFCHRCGYCLPCEQGVRIPEVMSFKSILKRMHPEKAVNFSRAAVSTVDNCTDCGECSERCPYTLPIPEMLRESMVLFNEAQKQQGKK
jgi:uncharacterized protein